MNSTGQAAMVDAIIFMILLTLASGIVLTAGNRIPGDDSSYQYSEDFADTVLSLDIEIFNNTRPLGNVLCDMTMLEISGASLDNGSWEGKVTDAGNALIRSGMGWAIESRTGESDAVIFVSPNVDGSDLMPDDVYASQRIYSYGGEAIRITVFTWVI